MDGIDRGGEFTGVPAGDEETAAPATCAWMAARCGPSTLAQRAPTGAARRGASPGGHGFFSRDPKRRLRAPVHGNGGGEVVIGVSGSGGGRRGCTRVRKDEGNREGPERGGGAHGNGRKPQNTTAGRMNSVEEFPQPGGTMGSGIRGEMRRREGGFMEKKRGINCGLKFPEINGI